MTTWIKKLVPGVLLCSLLGGSAWAQTRIATVNLQKVFDKYWRTGQVSAGLKDRFTELQKTKQEMVDDYRKSIGEYQKLLEEANNQAISVEERDRRKKAAEAKLKSLKSAEDNIAQFERQMEVTIGEQRARLRKNLLDEIRPAIDSKARSGGYALVLDTGAQTYVHDPAGPYSTPNLLYWSETNDLTDAVISQLNAAAPLDLPKPEEKPAPPKAKN
jgi:outer membrane protein